MPVDGLNEQILCGFGVACHSVQCKDGGLDCDTSLCTVDRDEGEEPGFYAHGRDGLNRRIFAEDNFSLAKETECKVTSYNHIRLDNAVRYSESQPYDERIKSGTVSMGSEIFFYDGYKLSPGTSVEFDRRGKIKALSFSDGTKTEFLGIDWPVGTRVTITHDKIDVHLNGSMFFKGFNLNPDTILSFEKRDGESFSLMSISAINSESHDSEHWMRGEVGGVKFGGVYRIAFDPLGLIEEVWAGKVAFSDKNLRTIEGFLAAEFQNDKIYSITTRGGYGGTNLDDFGFQNTTLTYGSIIKFDSDETVSSIVALGMGLESEKATICGEDYKEPVEVWFDKEGLPDGHVKYFREKPVLVYEHYPVYEGISIGGEQIFAYGNEFWFDKNEEGVPQYDKMSSMILSRDQRLLSPEFVTSQVFPKGTRLWHNSSGAIVAAKLSSGGLIHLMPSFIGLGAIEREDFFPAGAILLFNRGSIPCALLEDSGYLHDITGVLRLGNENPSCAPEAFSLSPLPL